MGEGAHILNAASRSVADRQCTASLVVMATGCEE
jgi:hypothetical protein